MARQVLPIVGAIVGAFFGAPQLGFVIGSLIGNAIDPQVIKGPSIGDGQTQTSKEGIPRPIIYGTACVAPNVIDVSEIYKSIKRTRQGKGGGPITEEERMHMTYALRISEGPVIGLIRAWEDEKLVYDIRPDGQVKADENAKFAKRFRFYLGGEDQMPDPELEVIHGAGNAPAYRGTCYIVFPRNDVTDRRGSIPNYRFEICSTNLESTTVYPDNLLDCVHVEQTTSSGGEMSSGPFPHYGIRSNIVPGQLSPYQPNSGIPVPGLLDEALYRKLFKFRVEHYLLNPGGFTSANAFAPSNGQAVHSYGLPVKLQLLDQANALIFDSGWIGFNIQQTDLNLALTAAGMPLESVINAAFVEKEIRLSPGVTSIQVKVFHADMSVSGSVYGRWGWRTSIDAPEQDGTPVIPSASVAHPTWPAALLTPDGDTLWACWAENSYTEIINVPGTQGKDFVGRIIRDIADRCKVDEDYMDTVQVDPIPVRGFLVAQQYAANNAMRALQNTFFFDPGEWDQQVHMIKRGGASTIAIELDDMAETPYNSERKSAIEYPRKIELMYQNATIGYDSAKADVVRNSPSIQVSGTQSLEVPVVMDETEAKQVADKQLKVAWAEAEGDVTFSVSYEFDYLTPTDCINTYLRDTNRRVRIEKIERADGILRLTGKTDRQSAYTSNLTAPPLPRPRDPPETITGVTQFAFLNIPALLDNHDILGYYVAGTGSAPAWYGAIVERSVADSEFFQVATLPAGSTMGYLTQAVAAASEFYPDTTNKLRVQLWSGDFESVSQELLLREESAIAICRPDGTAEIVQFRDALSLGNGLYELSYLIRGRLNSKATAHSINDKVVWLLDARLVSADTTLINIDLTHRATSYGETPEDSIEYTHDYEPVMMQYEFPVDLLELEEVGSDIVATWSPRERFGTSINPVRSVNWVTYRVTATDGSATITVDTTSPTATIAAGGFTGTVTVKVEQVNRITGAGEPKTATILI